MIHISLCISGRTTHLQCLERGGSTAELGVFPPANVRTYRVVVKTLDSTSCCYSWTSKILFFQENQRNHFSTGKNFKIQILCNSSKKTWVMKYRGTAKKRVLQGCCKNIQESQTSWKNWKWNIVTFWWNSMKKPQPAFKLQGGESSDFNLISDFFALHKTPFSDF